MLWNSVRPGQEDFRRKRIIRDLKKHRRCYIAHASGSGKTILSNMIRHELGANRTVFFCPTRALVFQTYRAYAAHCAEHALAFRGLAVVSASPPAEYPFLIEQDCGHPYRQASGGTGEIIRFLSEARESADPSIIFATYHGRRKIVDALAEVNMCVDLKIMDEAHHLTGSIGKAWQELLSDETLRATYRLAMTGTPRFVGDPHRASVLIGLDTAELFGVCSSTFSIRDAIEAKVIVPYQFYLAVMTRREEHELKQLVEEANAEVRNSADRIRYKDALAAATAIKAIKYKGLKKGFTFHSRIHRAAEFTSIVRRLAQKKKLSKNVFIDMVSSGSTNDHKERVHEAIRRSRKAIIANVNMFGEGFDETSIDFVVYVDPRNSRVNIVQSALRAMRLHEGKTHGAVILPITIHPRENDVELILQSDYWRIGQAILAFATFDEAMNDWATGTRGGYQTVERMPEFPSGLPMQIIGMPKALAAVEDQLVKSVHLHVRDTVYFRGALDREALRRTRDVLITHNPQPRPRQLDGQVFVWPLTTPHQTCCRRS
jgi:predicted helicase